MKRNGTTSTPRRNTDQESPIQAITAATLPSEIDIRYPLENLAIELTHEEIAHRAYQLYEARGGEDGRDLQDWFQAERELRQFFREAAGKLLMAEGLYAAV